MLLSDISVKRPVFTTMVIAALVVFGLVAWSRIGLDMLPSVEFPLATVLTVYPGAGPETVEQEVTKKIEDALSTINGVRSLRSVSVENVSQVIVEFELEVKIDRAVQDVRDKVAGVVMQLPKGVETPKIQKLDLGAIPILQIAVSGPGDIGQVTAFARQRVKEALQAVSGVGNVDLVGGQEREISVWLDPDRLETLGLTVQEVLGALAANNLEFPGGRLSTGQTEFSVRVDGRAPSLEALRRLKVLEIAGRAVRLEDVARIEDGFEEKRSSALISGRNTVMLVVYKQSGTNAVAVADAVKTRLTEIKAAFPAGWQAEVASDETLFTRASIEHVQFDLWFGALLAVVIVFLFLRNGRATVIAALAIPTSIVGTFIFLYALGFTFNTMTMLALSLSVGLLIDDAIVVIENIFRHREKGQPAREAALRGTAEIGLAVLATTLSIVAVFIPVAFTRGMVGRFFYEFGVTVSVAVLISLFVSFTLTPMLSSRFLKEARENRFYRLLRKALDGIDSLYRRLIAWALDHRLATLAMALGAFVAALLMARLLPSSFIPSFDQERLNVVVKTPLGTSLVRTEEIAERVAEQVRSHRELVLETITQIGADAQKKQHQARIYVKLVPKRQRRLSQTAAMDLLRRELADTQGAQVSVEEINILGGDFGMRSAKIQFCLRGSDLEELSATATRFAERLAREPGFVDVETTWETGKPEVRVEVDAEKATALGVSTASVGQALYALVGGVEASKFRSGGEDYTIRVRLEESARRRPEQMTRLRIWPMRGGEAVPLGSLARIRPASAPQEINRQARQRQVMVLANLTEGTALGSAMERVEALAREFIPPHIQSGFEGQGKIARESMQNLMFSLLLAVIMVYMVLAAQFESFLHPLTIMMSLPLSIVGALGALLLASEALSIIAMIGIIMLMGLVTKNAILLVDYTNTLRRRDGLERTDALLRAGPTRLRPILMTTAAMIFGMLPVALSRGSASEMRSPMAVAVIGGLVVSTLLTLVVVPVVYSLLDDLGLRLSARKKPLVPGRATTTA